MPNTIEFFSWEKDEPFEVQLEPEVLVFIVFPKNVLKFEAHKCTVDFKWGMRIDHKINGIQLFPDTQGSYEIKVYENEVLIEDWHSFINHQETIKQKRDHLK
jgi:hypothetical protein